MLYWYDPAQELDIPIACSRTCTFSVTPSFREVTDSQSAFFKKVIPDIAEWGISAEGLVIARNFNYLHFLQFQKDRTALTVKFVIDNGETGLVIIAGIAYIGPLSFTGTNKEMATYSLQMPGSGEYSITGATITPGGIIIEGGTPQRYEYDVTSDSTTIAIPALLGATVVLSIVRGTQETAKIIYAGTPTGPEIKVNLGTGVLEAPADNPFLNGEIISGLYS